MYNPNNQEARLQELFDTLPHNDENSIVLNSYADTFEWVPVGSHKFLRTARNKGKEVFFKHYPKATEEKWYELSNMMADIHRYVATGSMENK